MDLRYLSYFYFNKKIEEPSKEFMDLFNSQNNSLDKPLFNDLGKIAYINRGRESSLIEFYFAFKNNYTNINRIKLINNILNRNGYNTLKYHLESNYYATEIKAYLLLKSNENEIISIRVNLTEKGMNNIDEVIQLIFGEINMIKKEINEDFINNYIEIENIKFNHKETKHINFIDDLNEISENYFINQKEILGNSSINLDMFKSYINNLNPNNVFIIIDSPKLGNSQYIDFNNTLNVTSKIYQINYHINSLTKDQINNLSNTYDDSLNIELYKNYSKSIILSEKPCYEKSPYKCIDKEYDPSSKLPYDLFVIKDESNSYYLNKIDRTYYIPFIKGFIQIQFNTYLIRNIINKETYPYLYLYLESFRYQFLKSDLSIDNKFYIPEILKPAIQITYSTYNDLLNNFQQFILDFFNTPIDQNYFEILKSRYIVKKSDKKEYSENELYEEMIKLFSRFISIDTVKFDLFTIDSIRNTYYNKFSEIYSQLNIITNQLFSLTFGDINTTTSTLLSNNLFKTIKMNYTQNINLKASAEKNVSIPERTSIIYYTKSDNLYMKHSRVLIMYEINKNSIKNYKIYINCAQNTIKEYMKREKGSAYDIKLLIENILNKYYLSIYAIGPIDNPENIELDINNAINKTFNITCPTEYIINYLNLRKNNSFISDEKLELLISKALNNEDTSFYDNIDYQTIITKLKRDLIDEPIRIVIFNYRGNITQEEFKNISRKISKEYSLNLNIKNNITSNIKYLSGEDPDEPEEPDEPKDDKSMEGYDEYDDLNMNDTDLIEKYSNIDNDILINQSEPIEILMNDSTIYNKNIK